MLALVSLTPQEASRRVRDYPPAMRQWFGIAAALSAQPEVRTLDEPANGVDPAGVRWMRDRRRRHRHRHYQGHSDRRHRDQPAMGTSRGHRCDLGRPAGHRARTRHTSGGQVGRLTFTARRSTTATSRFTSSGRVVMDLMGWSDQRMSLRYQHVIDELRRDAAFGAASHCKARPAPMSMPSGSGQTAAYGDHPGCGGAEFAADEQRGLQQGRRRATRRRRTTGTGPRCKACRWTAGGRPGESCCTPGESGTHPAGCGPPRLGSAWVPRSQPAGCRSRGHPRSMGLAGARFLRTAARRDDGVHVDRASPDPTGVPQSDRSPGKRGHPGPGASSHTRAYVPASGSADDRGGLRGRYHLSAAQVNSRSAVAWVCGRSAEDVEELVSGAP